MTNSLDEHTIRTFTISQKKWLFSGSPKGAKASATTFSLIETAKTNSLDPYDYIEYLLEMMPNVDIVYHPEEIDNYLPWNN